MCEREGESGRLVDRLTFSLIESETCERHGPSRIGQYHRVIHHGRTVRVGAAVALGEGTLGRPDLDLGTSPADKCEQALIIDRCTRSLRHGGRGPSVTYQLLLIRPTGTSPVGESFCDNDLPNSQHTAENVEKRVWPGEKF